MSALDGVSSAHGGIAPDIDGVHHVGVIAHDLGRLARTYERLGFQLTPLSLPRVPMSPGGPPEPLGAGNRCAILRNGYLELLGVVDAACWSAVPAEVRGPFDIDRPLARGEGLHVLHLQSANLDLTRLRLIEAGLEPSPVRPFSREVDTPGGSRTMRAASVSFPSGRFPEALFQIARHETPELVLQPRYMIHANGAVALAAVEIHAADPAVVAERYARYAGRRVVGEEGDLAVRLPDFAITVRRFGPDEHDADEAGGAGAARLVGFSITADVDRTRAFLDGRGVRYEDLPDGLRIAAADAGGATVTFLGAI